MDPVKTGGKQKREGRKIRKPSSRRVPPSGSDGAGSQTKPMRTRKPPKLRQASVYEELSTIRLMVTSKQDWVNSQDCLGFYPLHLAQTTQNLHRKADIIKYLVEHDADVNVTTGSGKTPLHLAAFQGFLDCAEILVKAGADVLAKDMNGHTPLDLARIWCNRDVARFLRDCIWEVEKKQEQKERILVQALYKELLNIVKQDNLRKKEKRIKEKILKWAKKKGVPLPKDLTPRVHVSRYHANCHLSDQTPMPTAAPSPSPWTIFIHFQSEKSPFALDLRDFVTLLRDSSSGQLQYTTDWDLKPHPTPNLSQDVVERVLFPKAFYSRITTARDFEPQFIDEVQHRRHACGPSTCPWTEVAVILAEALELKVTVCSSEEMH